MALVSELMSASAPARLAELIAQDTANTGLTATGSTQADALVLTSKASVFSTVASNTGAILGARGTYLIFNGGANPLKVYPPVGSAINASATNAAFSVTNGKGAVFFSNGLTWFANLSA